MALRAPLAVPVEVKGPDRRVFRLSVEIGEDGVRLCNPAPFEDGRPVEIGFTLPDGQTRLDARARVRLTDDDADGEHGGRELSFIDPTERIRADIKAYVASRLGLPPLG